jgi:hypothetical protein
METATLGLKVDTSGAKEAIEVFNTLADAAERASKALDELAGKAGNDVEINIKIVGAVAAVDIKPFILNVQGDTAPGVR